MNKVFTLKNLGMDIWLLDQLKQAPAPGLTLEELQMLWTSNKRHSGILSRTTLSRHRESIKEWLGIIIHTPDKKHYSIANPEDLALDSLANDLLASVQEYLFLDEYRDLGPAIQPQQIWAGLEYLHPIGDAIRHRNKLKVRYQKFSDDKPYDAILHPYCLKAFQGRWYILAIKENSSHPIQTFALDRTLSLHVLEDQTYDVDNSIDVEKFFIDAFGVWVDPEHNPIQNVIVRVPKWVIKYWKTLPLHHSQRFISEEGDTGIFQFHISMSPDFIGELKRWDVDVENEIQYGTKHFI